MSLLKILTVAESLHCLRGGLDTNHEPQHPQSSLSGDLFASFSLSQNISTSAMCNINQKKTFTLAACLSFDVFLSPINLLIASVLEEGGYHRPMSQSSTRSRPFSHILPCHSIKSTGVINALIYGSVPFKCTSEA